MNKIDQLWEDFEISARYDGLAYAERSFLSDNIHEDIVKDLSDRYKKMYFAQEPLSDDKHSVTKNGTSPRTSTGDKEMDALVAELSEPEPKLKPVPKPKKQVHGKRQVEKEIGKDLILHFLTCDRNRRRRGFKI